MELSVCVCMWGCCAVEMSSVGVGLQPRACNDNRRHCLPLEL